MTAALLVCLPLQAEVVQLKAEEQDRERQIQELASKRDNASRMVSVKVQRMRDTQELVKVKEIIASDLKKVRKDTVARVKDFQQLYDLVKSQRNKFVNLIQVRLGRRAALRKGEPRPDCPHPWVMLAGYEWVGPPG